MSRPEVDANHEREEKVARKKIKTTKAAKGNTTKKPKAIPATSQKSSSSQKLAPSASSAAVLNATGNKVSTPHVRSVSCLVQITRLFVTWYQRKPLGYVTKRYRASNFTSKNQRQQTRSSSNHLRAGTCEQVTFIQPSLESRQEVSDGIN
ncbi:MAG: hypothetical protein LQ350_004607 [Teloschistes chrysophthalmus]|nr:MAG: hypothetical protein LQ350_004607 [Niorma chrysophthalma]